MLLQHYWLLLLKFWITEEGTAATATSRRRSNGSSGSTCSFSPNRGSDSAYIERWWNLDEIEQCILRWRFVFPTLNVVDFFLFIRLFVYSRFFFYCALILFQVC